MSSTSENIRNVWNAKVWTNTTATNITPNIFDYDVLPESQSIAATLYDSTTGILNFFTYLTGRDSQPKIMGQVKYNYQVMVNYFLQQTDQPQSNYNAVQDALDTIDDLVLAQLGGTWNNTVSVIEGCRFQQIKPVTVVDGKKCWHGGLLYKAYKQT